MSKKTLILEKHHLYRFCGTGQGIPGLPHEVTVKQAEDLGLLEVLQAAVQNGNYRQVQTTPAGTAEKGE